MGIGLNRAARVSVALLFAVGTVSSTATVLSRPLAAKAKIKIKFGGLLVFDTLIEGKQVVSLFDDADHHEISIKIKGPGFDTSYEWWDHYGKDANIQLLVTNTKGAPVSEASWSSGRPYKIGTLHPTSSEPGELVMVAENLKPTFTLNSGEFEGEEKINIKFERVGQTIFPSKVPRKVEAEIELVDGQTAQLIGKDPLPSIDLSTGKWEITVENNPVIGHVCGYHFDRYYYGFLFRKEGGKLETVPQDLRFTAKPRDPVTSPCPEKVITGQVLKIDMYAIPSRPCIPISN